MIANTSQSLAQATPISETFTSSEVSAISEGLASIDIPLNLQRLPNNSKALVVPVRIANHLTTLHLDTGSSGIRILEDSLPLEVLNSLTRTGDRHDIQYADGTTFSGETVIAPIQIGTNPNQAISTTTPIAIHLIDTITCSTHNPDCFSDYINSDIHGIIGLSLNARGSHFSSVPQSPASSSSISNPASFSSDIYSPISRLPAPINNGYIIRTNGFYSVTATLTLGLTPTNLHGFHTYSLAQRQQLPSTFDDGTPIWLDSSLSLSYQVESPHIPTEIQQFSGPTLFDSGSAQIVLTVPEIAVGDYPISARLWPGVPIRAEFPISPDATTSLPWTLQSGTSPSRNQVFIRSSPTRGLQILGLPFFYDFDVAFDLEYGRIGVRANSN